MEPEYLIAGVLIPGRGGIFSLCHHIQTISGTCTGSYPVGTRGSCPGVGVVGL